MPRPATIVEIQASRSQCREKADQRDSPDSPDNQRSIQNAVKTANAG